MRRVNHNINYRETKTFHVNELTENYHYDWFKTGKKEWMKAVHFSAYHICEVYTDKGTILHAYLKLNGRTATKQVIFNADRTRVETNNEQVIISQILYNDTFNCHGYTFLDGLFWFELNQETVQIIIEEDGYVECTQATLKENGVLLFYDINGALIHSAKKFNAKTDKNSTGLVVSKFGINKILTRSEEEIYEKYKSVDQTKTRYYNRG